MKTRNIILIKGPYKGYYGEVRAKRGPNYEILLRANYKTIFTTRDGFEYMRDDGGFALRSNARSVSRSAPRSAARSSARSGALAISSGRVSGSRSTKKSTSATALGSLFKK
ncbi:MAG: hypothetical protein EHM20_11785, partial [Alphaproteobacteria bacterium]